MTEQVDLDALIAEARGFADWWDASPHNSDLIYGMHRMVDAPGGERVMEKREVSATSLRALADALESTVAELRQERERADKVTREYELILTRQGVRVVMAERDAAVAALSRAEETIEAVEDLVTRHYLDTHMGERVLATLHEYDKQKEADRG